jgi:hypothetical protein
LLPPGNRPAQMPRVAAFGGTLVGAEAVSPSTPPSLDTRFVRRARGLFPGGLDPAGCIEGATMQDLDGLDARRERAAKNQSLFREVNERIKRGAGAVFSTAFVCECLQEECDARVTLPLEDYEQLRASSNSFFVLHGHAYAEIEETVETRGEYLVVKKLGVGAEVAEGLDPRAREARHVG